MHSLHFHSRAFMEPTTTTTTTTTRTRTRTKTTKQSKLMKIERRIALPQRDRDIEASGSKYCGTGNNDDTAPCIVCTSTPALSFNSIWPVTHHCSQVCQNTEIERKITLPQRDSDIEASGSKYCGTGNKNGNSSSATSTCSNISRYLKKN